MTKKQLKEAAKEILNAHQMGDMPSVVTIGHKYAKEFEMDYSDLMQKVSEISHEILGKGEPA